MNKYIKGMLNFEVHVSEHCNLNCKGCFHFSPLAEPEFLDVIQYEKDLARLSELFYHEVEYINLMGGEPLLNPEIIKIIQLTRQYFPHGKIRVVTNGLKLGEMPDEFWEACHDNSVSINPTLYPIGLDLEEPKKKAACFRIKASKLPPVHRSCQDRWTDEGHSGYLRPPSRYPGAGPCTSHC